ncbi:MAG: universal stress protein [Spirochaetaceae bacterium]|nr:universal stress protein [Spirochaetaceae bacterium]
MIKSLFKNVLVVVNSSEASIQAVKYAALLAKIYHCAVKIVYVVDTATIRKLALTKLFIQEESEEYISRLIEDGKRYLKHTEEICAIKGVKVQTEMRKGSICAEVIAVADEMKADMILLGAFEKPGEDPRDVISSSYRQIIVKAHCSVLVVKESMIEKLFKMA